MFTEEQILTQIVYREVVFPAVLISSQYTTKKSPLDVTKKLTVA